MQGINLIGYFKGSFGLAVTTRAMAALMVKQGINFCIIDIADLSPHQLNTATEDFSSFADYFSDTPVYEVNLFISGINLKKHFDKLNTQLALDRQFNVWMVFVETYELGDMFMLMKDNCDMLIAPTRFIQYSLMRLVDKVYIEYMPPPLAIDQALKTKLLKGKRENKQFTFFYNFDLNSCVVRKNPYVLIRSFLEEFADDASVQLTIKVNGASLAKHQDQVNFLKNICADQNINLLFDYLPYHENLALIANADCYVSPHRSEGLGNGLFEAMHLGVPCIATGFGGNTEFMNHNNAILLNYELELNTSEMYRYFLRGKLDYWANISHLDLMFAMRRMREDEALREQLIQNAFHTVNQLESEFLATRVFESVFAKYDYEKIKQAHYAKNL
jgi:glycosyltransferase involved in cell wall biosynthesis